MKIFHTADIHLGRRRLDGRLPDSDLAHAFDFIASEAIAERADIFLVAGDLFDRPQVEPPHLRQAQDILLRLKEANIPVVAIEGNHDKEFILSDRPTWVNYLAEDDLLILLRTPFDGNGPIMLPWDAERKVGSWVDIAGVRLVGAGYLGAATPHKVRQIALKLEPDRTQVLLLHAGPDYFVGEGGGFSAEDLATLKTKVVYLALGHIHKPMLHADWACNPGSPENCDIREAILNQATNGSPLSRGYAVVEIDPANRLRPRNVEIRSNPRRPVYEATLDCTPFGNKTKDGATALVRAATDLIKRLKPMPEGVVNLRLSGKLNLNRIALDHTVACAEIEAAAAVRTVCFDLTALNIDGSGLSHCNAAEGLSREDLEKIAIREMLEKNRLWGLEDRESEFAGLFYELKEAVRSGKLAEEITEKIAQSPLVEMIRDACAHEATQAQTSAARATTEMSA